MKKVLAMSYDEGSWKRRIINFVIGILSAPLYPFKKMRDYRDDDIWEEPENQD